MTDIKQRYLACKRALFDRFFAHLNEQQKKAVYQINGPLLILAGAGSGKTKVLVERIAYMMRYGNAYQADSMPFGVDESDVEALEAAQHSDMSRTELRDLLTQFAVSPVAPWRILAITFTNKAANEMKSRLAASFPDQSDLPNSIWAGTFHAICMRILRRYAVEAGLPTGFTVYDTDDSKKAMRAALKAVNIDEKVLPVKTALNYVSRAKDKLIAPEDFLAECGNDYRMQLFAKAYAAYQARLAESGALDFDDIIFRTVKLLRDNPEILAAYQKQFQYVSVDEYQDTNEAQFYLTALLSGGSNNLMAVGDDDQSIYKFRGATIENIRNFTKVFSSAKLIRLEENYRSTQRILDAANAVIAHNEKAEEMRKVLFTRRGDGAKIHVLNPDDQNAEARTVADQIRKKVAAGEAHYRDFAILFRTNAQSNALESVFARSGLPYRVLGGTRFADRKEIRDVVAYLQLITNHGDKDRLYRIVNEPRRKIGEKTLAAVEEIAALEKSSMLSVMAHAGDHIALARSAKTLSDFAALIEELTELLPTVELPDFVNIVLDKTGYRQMLLDGGEEEKERLDNLEEFISGVIEYTHETETPTLTEFLEMNTLVADVDRYDDTADAVVMMTIHSAKGLEFPEVFLPGFEEGIFPGMNTVMAGPAELEEERRLAYVAITRAKNELTILHAKQRLLYGRTAANPASRFLSEIPEELLDRPAKRERTVSTYSVGANDFSFSTTHAQRGAKKPAAPTQSFGAGERVRHNIFGEGTILTVQKIGSDTLLEVAFDTKGTKKLMANYAKLEKL